MAHVPSTSTAPTRSPLRARSAVLDLVGRVDDTIYAAERAIVTTSLLLMSGVVCLNIYYQFLAAMRAGVRLASAGDGPWAALWPVPLLAVGVWFLARAAFGQSAWGRNNGGMSAALASLTVVAVAGLGALMLAVPSHVVCALLAFKIGAITILAQLDRPRPLGTPAFGGAQLVAVGIATVGSIAAIAGAWMLVPEGYTWAQKVALFLLLWIAFIGASMATHDGQHLRVDAVRKAVPQRLLPWYNAASYLIAALFTLGFLYLSWMYFHDRLAETNAPGEIPDWLKVLSIPVALAMVSIRFLGRAVASALVGAWGLHDEEAA